MSEKEMRENEDTRPGNLKLGRKFSSEYQASPEAKSRGKREKKLFKEVCAEKLMKKYKGGTFQDVSLDEMISNFENMKPGEQLDFMRFMADYSGQKPKDEPQTIIMPSINIKGI